MALPYRHNIWNSSPGDLRPRTLPLGHRGSPQYWIFTSVRGRNILFLWSLKARVGFEPAMSDFLSWQLSPLQQGPRPVCAESELSCRSVRPHGGTLRSQWGQPQDTEVIFQGSCRPASHPANTRGIDPMLFQCWVDVKDVGPTLKQQWVNASCLLARSSFQTPLTRDVGLMLFYFWETS